MVYASQFGFRAGGDPAENSRALQKAVDMGGYVTADGQGIADVSIPVRLHDDTTLFFEPGLVLRRNPCPKGIPEKQGASDAANGYVLVNDGAFTGKKNHHITVDGLHLICNGIMSFGSAYLNPLTVPGLRGMIAFYHVTDLTITGFETYDLPAGDFAVHVCDFENLRIENVRIEGRKDAVHLGCGSKFVIRHGIFRTFDDPIALNAHDYATSNPMLGWITDGVIEDCWDLDDKDTTGFFCRILAGSWCDWKPGMQIQNSDTVVYDHRLYRAFLDADGKIFESKTPPTHKTGTEVIDGIPWCMVQEGDIHNCGCKNIVFRDIRLEKHRPTAFSFHFDKDAFSRSVYPYSEMPRQTGILFDNVRMSAEIPLFLVAVTPVDEIKIRSSELINTRIALGDIRTPGETYDETPVTLEGCRIVSDEGSVPLADACDGRSIRLRTALCSVSGKPQVAGNVTVGENDLGL